VKRLQLVWLQSGGCGGCSLSLLGADGPDLLTRLEGAGIDLLYHPSLSATGGIALLTLLERLASGRVRLDLLCIEGAVVTGPEGSGRFHLLAGSGVPMMEWIRRLALAARHVVAVGSCAAFGGINRGGGNPSGSIGLQFDGEQPGGLLGTGFRAVGGLPVVNVAGCPVHPDWVSDTLTTLTTGELEIDQLDELARPRTISDHLVHHGCPRNEFYEFKASADSPSQLGCLMEHMGCLGTQARADCNLRHWNRYGSCLHGGAPCINCTAPGFEEPGHPFARTPKVAGIPVGLPTDMPKAWFVALASLAKAATPQRLRENAHADHIRVAPGSGGQGRGERDDSGGEKR
jgi:NiFe hydrogenase small subunit HydA